MDVSIINIGNSKGIRLSKTIIEKYNIQEKVEIILQEDQIILKPKPEPRKNWEKAFKTMHRTGEDRLLIDDVFTDESFEEWKD